MTESLVRVVVPVQLSRATGADVVVGNLAFDFWRLSLPFPFLPRLNSMTGPQAAELSIHLTRFPAFAWNKLYRRDLFHPDDPPFPNTYHEDLATTPRILMRASTVALTRKVYDHYSLRGDSTTGNFGAKNVSSFAAAIDILRRDIHQNGRWESWQPSYRGLLREALVMMAIQVLLQPNQIPIRSRGAVLARYAQRLRALAEPPTDGHRLRVVRLRSSAAPSSLARRVVSATVRVAKPRTVPGHADSGTRQPW